MKHRKVGIEIEYGISLRNEEFGQLVYAASKKTGYGKCLTFEFRMRNAPKWVIKPECGGSEINTPASPNLGKIYRGLRVIETGLSKKLRKLEYKSERPLCDPRYFGLHVHVETKDLVPESKLYERFRLIANFSVWEKYFFQLQDPARRRTGACYALRSNLWSHFNRLHGIPFYKLGTASRLGCLECESLLEGMSEEHLRSHSSSLDFGPLYSIGTVEFRIGGSTIVAKDIINWADLCRRFVTQALKCNYRPKDTGFEGFLKFIKAPGSLKRWARARRAHFSGGDKN